ncbi:MAG: hypothetical protein H8D82_01185 [Euryarchaeota archaeon]|nr:hypothetical protein [Euryarchaeota archaeon]
MQAQIQSITYNEFLPSIGVVLEAYTSSGYNSSINPSVSNEFTLLVAFASGSQMSDSWLQLNETGVEIESGNLDLRQGFWTQQPLTDAGGIEPTIRGAVATVQREMDVEINPSLRNLMSGAAWGGWMDDCAMDIQRGRDRGLPDYNSLRSSLGLEPITNWSNLTSDIEMQQVLAIVYNNVSELDAYIGVLVEPRLNGSIYGETQQVLALDQFSRLRDGDRMWYRNDADLVSLYDEIDTIRLSDIILRNSRIESIQCDVFFAERGASGTQCQLENVDSVVEPVTETTSSSPIIQSMIGVFLVIVLLGVAAMVVRRQEAKHFGKKIDLEEE